ncbi:acyloxyacyl hydrolase [uncultured Shimia sp.]|uniref:acyloxyacyl hydrolase n=1 Tax=uncultured Shimia sp. TaxID=573152 RepID=UPI002637E44E|nr:acyloxyacyl hydrolase [uncultured Shimia sp.]
MKPLITLGAALLLSTHLSAQELTLGLGYADYSDGSAIDASAVELEYISAPFRHYGPLAVSFGAVTALDTEDNVFIGAGLAGTYEITERWFAQASLMPGVFVKGPSQNDLGQPLEFRSLLGVGYRLTQSTSLSLAISHKSNASLSPHNPGVNTLTLRYHHKF